MENEGTYERCSCGKKSLAGIVDHICVLCEEQYVFCTDCLLEKGGLNAKRA